MGINLPLTLMED